MTLPRLVLLFLLALSILTSGCSSYWEQYTGPHRKYYRVRVTNPRGELISDYIAEGYVGHTERGYHFKAVERTTHEPYALNVRYPQGRHLDVAGPNIVVTRCGKPLWLFELEGY